MGARCCPPSREQSEFAKNAQIITDLVGETDDCVKPLTSINEVRSIPMHESRKMLETKCLNNTQMATTYTSGQAQDRPSAVSSNMKSNLTYIKCPTNFKIEPGHFRIEKKKETLEDRYVIEDVIGQGKFGVVRRIQDRQSELYRAIKIINKANCQETDNLVDEIKIIKSLVVYSNKR